MSNQEHSFSEKTITTQTLYDGKMIQLERLTVALPNGKEAQREIVRHPGAVAVLAETNEGEVVVVQQWRKAIDRLLLEIPAGKLEPGEDPVVCAHRELREETGNTAHVMKEIASFYTSPGFADEKITLFYASGLEEGDANPDDDEFLSLHTLSRDQVHALLTSGQVVDAKTLIAFQWWIANGNER